MKELYDRRMRDARYAKGDRAVTYKIRRGHKPALVVHADRLWRYHDPGPFSWGSDEPEEEGSAEEDVLEAMEDVPKEVEEAVGGDAGDSQLVVETATRLIRHRRPPVYLRDFKLS
ncbi:hypothetical protein E2C01_088998 [Portunus trituberculatus]|uniref:Uncharacterized protein n=1 Tax=Portunus trituberculatus TaxID=210409 RepID=A0A5B7JHK0_PORTR|nr:hypothetical protein [Portunus trituberculatus]